MWVEISQIFIRPCKKNSWLSSLPDPEKSPASGFFIFSVLKEWNYWKYSQTGFSSLNMLWSNPASARGTVNKYERGRRAKITGSSSLSICLFCVFHATKNNLPLSPKCRKTKEANKLFFTWPKMLAMILDYKTFSWGLLWEPYEGISVDVTPFYGKLCICNLHMLVPATGAQTKCWYPRFSFNS